MPYRHKRDGGATGSIDRAGFGDGRDFDQLEALVFNYPKDSLNGRDELREFGGLDRTFRAKPDQPLAGRLDLDAVRTNERRSTLDIEERAQTRAICSDQIVSIREVRIVGEIERIRRLRKERDLPLTMPRPHEVRDF